MRDGTASPVEALGVARNEAFTRANAAHAAQHLPPTRRRTPRRSATMRRCRNTK